MRGQRSRLRDAPDPGRVPRPALRRLGVVRGVPALARARAAPDRLRDVRGRDGRRHRALDRGGHSGRRHDVDVREAGPDRQLRRLRRRPPDDASALARRRRRGAGGGADVEGAGRAGGEGHVGPVRDARDVLAGIRRACVVRRRADPASAVLDDRVGDDGARLASALVARLARRRDRRFRPCAGVRSRVGEAGSW